MWALFPRLPGHLCSAMSNFRGQLCATVITLALVSASLPAPALADDGGVATELFNQGRALLQSGANSEACARFRRSFDLDARTGTLLNIAECEERTGHLVEAHKMWVDATAFARTNRDPRAAYSAERAEAVERRIPRLVLRLAPDIAKNSLVTLDGTVIQPSALTTSSIDPGEHLVVMFGPERGSRSLRVKLSEGELREVELDAPNRSEDSAPAFPKRASLDTTYRSTSEPRAVEPKRDPALWVRPAAYGLALVGIVSLTGGSIFGIEAISKKASADSIGGCSGNRCATEVGLDLRADAATAARWATIAFGVAGVTTLGSIVLFALAPTKQRTGSAAQSSLLRVSMTPFDITASGTF